HVGFGPAHGIAGTGSLVWFARLGLPALLVYLRLWFFPWPLNPYYTSHDLAIGSLAIGGVLASALLLFLGARSGRTRAALGAFAFALLFLAPVLHLAPLGGAVAAERFFYLPSAGLALLTGLALESFELYRSARIASRLAVVAAMAACIPATVNGVKPWASDATLFAHMVEVSPDAATAHRGLADVLLKAGNPAGAIREAREATRLDPGFADAYELLGVASAKAKDYDTARESFLTVARLDPDRASAYVNLGVLAVETNDLEAAEKYFTRAVEIDPANPDFHFKLGTVFVMKGDADGALREVANLETLDHAKAESLRQMMTPPPATTPSPGR
ncbi:MAG TPA: tetratricopeptide repeat protein, partial [Candidatus Krumholzibacteria bacterium]|nr:tetratricopeptide repeat protein [Candidatus Krumholzibacteria bacterium]